MSEGTPWPSVVTLANSIIGVSVLAMPYCFKEMGVILGPLLLMLCSYLTRKSCHFLVKAGSVAGRRSYEFLALHAFGPVGKLGVELCTIGLMLATCVGFFVIIGDLAPPIFSKILGIPNASSLRASIMILAAFGVALPLGLLRKLSSLASVSSLSFGFYFALVFFLFLQAVPNLFSDAWTKGPQRLYYWRPAGILKCFPIFGLAFACQTQIFPMYDTMSDPSLKRMLVVIDNAINMVFTIYLTVGFFGVMAYYDRDVVGDILLSFRPSIMGEAIKLGFVLSVAISFPLIIFPCRLSINTLLFPLPKKGSGESLSSDGAESAGVGYIPPLRFKGITLGIILLTLVVGIQVPGIESILGLVGSTVGVTISFIFPSMMFLYLATSYGESREKLLSKIILCVGLFIMLSSTYTNLTETKIKPLPVGPSIPSQPPIKVEELLPVHKDPSVIPDVQEVRREPPVPNEPVDVVVKKKDVEVDVKKIVDVKIAASPEEKKVLPDKDDYDNLKEKIDAAEKKHDVLIKQLEKQQEQQQVIMEQQNQIIEQLKEKQDPGPAGQAAAGPKTASDTPVVIKELEKTKREIVDANKVLSHVAQEAKNVETDVEQTAHEAAARKVVGKNGAKSAADAALSAAKKKVEEAELSKKVEEAAKYMAEEEEKKKKAAAAAKEALAKEAAKKKAEEQESLAKKMEEAARYLAEQEAKKKLAEEEEEKKKKAEEEAKAAKVIADAKLAAEEAKQKEEEAHKAAELAVQKVLEAKKAANDAEVKIAILKEVAASAAPGAVKKDVDKIPEGAAVAVENAPQKVADSPKPAPGNVPAQPVVARPAVADAGIAAAVKSDVVETQDNNDEKDALKKKLETHEKLIVKMHQKIQDIEKENEAKKEVPLEERKENPKPLGLKAESLPSAKKLSEHEQAKLPQGVVEVEIGNVKKTIKDQVVGLEQKLAADGKPSEEGDL